MDQVIKSHCRHVYGVARDKAHAGELLTDDFFYDGNRPGNAHYKCKSAAAWLKPNNADLFPFCPACGSRIKPEYLAEILNLADETTPEHVRKFQDMAAEHNARAFNAELYEAPQE